MKNNWFLHQMGLSLNVRYQGKTWTNHLVHKAAPLDTRGYTKIRNVGSNFLMKEISFIPILHSKKRNLRIEQVTWLVPHCSQYCWLTDLTPIPKFIVSYPFPV